jgi:deoxyribodipyrimidine photo-lyase
LRLQDNLTLQKAVEHGPILPVFILDRQLLSKAPVRKRDFLFNSLYSLDADLRSRGSYLVFRKGSPIEILSALLCEIGAEAIYAEEDFTPYALQRDKTIATQLPIDYVQGQIVHHPQRIHKADGTPYTVYTPFSKTWKNIFPDDLIPISAPNKIPTIRGVKSESLPQHPQDSNFPSGEAEALDRLQYFLDNGVYTYAKKRNRLDLDGTSFLSPYIHFGLLGLRTAASCAHQAVLAAPEKSSRESAQTWLNELIWREFYIHILYHFPEVHKRSFRPKYDRIRWQNDLDDFSAWKEGKTGYPVVDAAMRQMLATGWMHNRARMIVASFLVKDLLIDWRWGENWFMQNLLDGDLAANNGGWQWTAGTGTDAAPYFRIFNPILQSKKFDPKGDYIRKWVPELAHLDSKIIHAPWEKNVEVPGYPAPIVDHKFARERTMAAYREV